jgi:hypothetical protein
VGCGNTMELVGLGCVDRSSDGLSGFDHLKHLGRNASLLVVDIQTLKWECFSICLQSAAMFQTMLMDVTSTYWHQKPADLW